MCGVGGMSLPSICFLFICFSANFFFFFGLLAVCGKRHGLGSLTFCAAADRRPIDPPPIVQLRVIDKARKNLPSPSPSPPPHQQQPPSHPHAPAPHSHESSTPLDTSMLTPAGFGGGGPFLQNPYYFMFASLAKPDDDTELHWMKVRSLCPFFFLVPCRAGTIVLPIAPCLASPYSHCPCFPRMAKRGVPRDRSSRHFITSKTRRMTTETLASSSSPILACARRGPTV